MAVLTVDGVPYPGIVIPPDGVKRNFAVLDGINAGRALSGRMVRDVIGTYYNYTLSIDARRSDRDEYDRLYEVLSAPVDSHTIVIPYGQGTRTYEAYVANGEDTLYHMRPDGNHWHGLSITFTAMDPARRPGGA